MHKFWMAYFVASIMFFGAIFSSLCVPLYILSRRYPKLLKWARFICQKGTGVLMWAQPWLKVNLDFRNYSSLKNSQPKILFVSNHRSHLDVFILLTQIPGVQIFANNYIFKVPFLGFMMRITEQIPVISNNLASFVRGIETLKSRIENGENALIFPELTRCPPGQKGTLEFSSAPFKAAMDVGAVVVPIVIQDTDRVWPREKMEIHGGVTIKFKMLEAIASHQFKTADEFRNFVRRKIDFELGERPLYPVRPREVTI